MYNHPIKKFAGLIVLYSIIIIGIFILQFRSELAFSRNIGLLRISLEQNIDDQGNSSLLNTVKASFKGITFTADNNSPAILQMKDSSKKDLKLLDWEQIDDGFKIKFSDDVTLNFTVTGITSTSSLNISASLPSNATSLFLSYKPDSSVTVTPNSSQLLTFASKNLTYKMSAGIFQDNYIVFTNSSPLLAYTYQEPPKQEKPKSQETKTFTYAKLPKTSPACSYDTYITNTNKFLANFLTQSTTAIANEINLSEKVVVAYVAEMGKHNRFTEAVNNVPDTFKKGSDRTYFSSPYFNNLVAMNPSLVKENDRISLAIRNAIASNNLSIFADPGIVLFMLRNPTHENVLLLSSMPAKLETFEPTLTQATGLIYTYALLKTANSSLAQNIFPVVENSLKQITSCSKLSLETLTLKENEEPVSFEQTIKTAYALIQYANATNDSDTLAAGYMLTNTAISQNPTAPLATAAELYPYLAPKNNYYPHFQVVGSTANSNVWSWTCADNISYTETLDNSECTIEIDFALGESHYIILRGIKPFQAIEIYGIPFHTDARFETYNSSGYVYNENTHTLYLKSRHKSSKEIVHLTFRKPRPAVSEESREVQETISTPATTPISNPAPAENTEKSASSSEYTDIPENEEE